MPHPLFAIDHLIRIKLPDVARTKEIDPGVEQRTRLFHVIKGKRKIKKKSEMRNLKSEMRKNLKCETRIGTNAVRMIG